MKKLSICIALAALLIAGAAHAAPATDAPTPGDRPMKHEGKPTKKRPTFKECDKDNDKALSLEEFRVCYPKAEKRFAAMDADKDGKVTPDEMKAYRQARKQERRRAFFTSCDTNGDGQLSFEEFDKCTHTRDMDRMKTRKARDEERAKKKEARSTTMQEKKQD